MVECVNALDEARRAETGGTHLTHDGRVMHDARWTDARDMDCFLRAFPRIDPETESYPFEKQKIRTDYFLSRTTSMPHVADQLYYFTSAHTGVQLRDMPGRSKPNRSRNTDLKYLSIVVDSLYDRSTRPVADPDAKIMALELKMAETSLQRMITMVGLESRPANKQRTIDHVVDVIIERYAFAEREFMPVRDQIVERVAIAVNDQKRLREQE